MDINKNYYSVLGVIPSVELIVIRAAYKALVQIYHPDRYAGDKTEAHQKMVEINEAYSILSDPLKRKEYDSLHKSKMQERDSYDESENEKPTYDPLKDDWDTVIEYYPDISELEKRLSKLSWKIGYSYRAYLLESKLFEERIKIANKLEQEFLETYFGDNSSVLDFAKELINSGNKVVAKELNKAIKVLGSQKSQEIIHRIRTKYNILSFEQKQVQILESLGCKVGFDLYTNVWRIESPKNKISTIKSIEELIVFTKQRQIEVWCEDKLEKNGYLLEKFGSRWRSTDSNSTRRGFDSIQELEVFAKSLKL